MGGGVGIGAPVEQVLRGEQQVPQWIVLPNHATIDPAASGAIGRAACRSNRTSVSPFSSPSSAGRMCAYAHRFSKWGSRVRGTTIMHPFSALTSLKGIHALSSKGRPSRNEADDEKSRWGIPKF